LEYSIVPKGLGINQRLIPDKKTYMSFYLEYFSVNNSKSQRDN
jgi:hypothetical protein